MSTDYFSGTWLADVQVSIKIRKLQNLYDSYKPPSYQKTKQQKKKSTSNQNYVLMQLVGEEKQQQN